MSAALAPASIEDMTPVEKIDRVARYALARLEAETRNAKRGTKARLAKMIGISTAHVTNMVKHGRPPGTLVLAKMVAYWGMSRAQLEDIALADDSEVPACNATLSRVADERNFSGEALRLSLTTASGVGAELSDQDASDILTASESYLRSVARVLADAGRKVSDVPPSRSKPKSSGLVPKASTVRADGVRRLKHR